MSRHAFPAASQRRHAYAYVNGCVPFQLPLFTVSVVPVFGVPEIEGTAVLDGAATVAWTAPVAFEVDEPEPNVFDAVTATRRRRPTSPVAIVYWREFAPPIG